MRAGARKVETKGSMWWFDERTREYMRMPKREAPRERPEWSDERAGVLQDAVWHPYEDWEIVLRGGQAILTITYTRDDGETKTVVAPDAIELR